MKLLVLGVDHRSAPPAQRERLAFDGPKLAAGLASIHAAFPSCETAILSTCNRVEIYLAAAEATSAPDPAAVAAWLAAFHEADRDNLSDFLISQTDEAVVGHLLGVAASVESLVVGEGQILGQVREAYRAAVEAGTAGPLLHALFQRALAVGKRVRELTGLDRGRLSVASIAVEVAQSVFDHFGDKVVLVIGAGKMGDLTLQHLSGLHPGRIVIANRSFDRASEAARRWRGEAVPFERLDDALAEADLVIGTTNADHAIVSYEDYRRIQRTRRGGRLVLILDLAMPRDFDPRIGDLDQVLLYNVDDLSAQVERNLSRRHAQIEPARQLVTQEAAAFVAELRHQREAGSLLRQLGDYGDDIAARELERFFASCPELSDAQRRSAEHMVHRLKNQFLHHPRTALRSAFDQGSQSHQGDPHPFLSAVRHIFGLGSESKSARHNRDNL